MSLALSLGAAAGQLEGLGGRCGPGHQNAALRLYSKSERGQVPGPAALSYLVKNARSWPHT